MNLDDFLSLFNPNSHPIILLEGRRNIDAESANHARRLASLLATQLPNSIFRSWNATGSDEAFSQGVGQIDPSRLEIVAPTKNHRIKSRIPGARYLSLADLDDTARQSLNAPSITACPRNKSMFSRDSLPYAV
ncbi:hypothetical protein JIN77_02565 [Verrucomicrobiaceae bacterium R5-34]|nr:hypothetical protein [Verrucomicrobiaceae bacterium R5-34]